MPRHPYPALGLAALAVILALLADAPRASAAPQTSETATTETQGGTAPPSESTVEKIDNAMEAHEAPGQPNILEPQPSLAIWTVVVFLGLLMLLGRFGWKPLLTALHQREEHLEHVLLETERARNEGEQLLAEHRKRLAAAEEQVRQMIEDARASAQAIADEIQKKAQAEAEASRHRAEREIASARDQALSEIWSKTADLAVSVAGRVLSRSISEDDHRRLVEAAIGELPAAPGGSSNGSGGQVA